MFIIMGPGGGIRPFPTQLPMMNGFKNYKGKKLTHRKVKHKKNKFRKNLWFIYCITLT